MVAKEFEQLCEKEFALKQDEACRGFDRELANLRAHYAHHGLLVSSTRAQAVMDAALLRFDKSWTDPKAYISRNSQIPQH